MANEKRLIDADALLESFGEEPLWDDTDAEIQAKNDWHKYRVIVKCQPIVDAVEVVHGRWKRMQFLGQNDRRTMEYFCSECQTLGSPQWKCCPVCMARMDGGNEDG